MTEEITSWVGIKAINWARLQCVGSPAGKNVLMSLAAYANDEGKCNPSQVTISKVTELSERAVREWLKKLEELGFLTRTRQKRADGYRDKDLITLNITKTPKHSSMELYSKPIRGSFLPANDSYLTGSSRQTYRQEVPPIRTILKKPKKPSSGAHTRGAVGFQKLWDDWPSKERPEKIKAAKWAFDRLSTTEQSSAVRQARRFRDLAKAKKDMALMIPYLKNREFQDLEGAPEINADGRFIITPDRPEWLAWRKHIGTKYSDAAVERLDARKSFFADARWPAEIVVKA